MEKGISNDTKSSRFDRLKKVRVKLGTFFKKIISGSRKSLVSYVYLFLDAYKLNIAYSYKLYKD